ncbi:MAG: hypothetical protein EB060_10580 [Proteobacteria bacterium]|nr:hypothetical protein [Pseudomonadota bacterium]
MFYECFYLNLCEAIDAANDFNHWANDCKHVTPSVRSRYIREMRYKAVRALQWASTIGDLADDVELV